MTKFTPPWIVGTAPLERASEVLAKLSGRMVREGHLTAITATTQTDKTVSFAVYVVPAQTHITTFVSGGATRTDCIYELITEEEIRSIITVHAVHDPDNSRSIADDRGPDYVQRGGSVYLLGRYDNDPFADVYSSKGAAEAAFIRYLFEDQQNFWMGKLSPTQQRSVTALRDAKQEPAVIMDYYNSVVAELYRWIITTTELK